MRLLRSLLAVLAAAAAVQAQAQIRPTVDYTDMWWNPAESGWGLSIRQKVPAGSTVDAIFAVWYTYDPRATDPASAGGTGNVPLWFVMPGGTWTASNSYTGTIYVTIGSPFSQAWNPQVYGLQSVGTYRLTFTDAGHGTFTYSISPPSGLPNTNPAANLPSMAGTKTIVRNSF
jgi:hypothetical protein